MSELTIGLYIIGDEILSGRRQDKHLNKVIEILCARGLALSWVQYLGDERARLSAAYQQSLATEDLVFSCGGIGGTPDDHTRQAVAAALNVPTVRHPEAVALIAARCQSMGTELTPERLRMAEFPVGAQIIPNPYNQIAGFSVGRHYFVPGFPVMAWPMIEWVLDTYYSSWFHQNPQVSQSMLVYEIMEATLTPLMERIEAEVPQVKVFSLPSVGEDGSRRHIDLGVKGEAGMVPIAYHALRVGVLGLGAEIGRETG